MTAIEKLREFVMFNAKSSPDAFVMSRDYCAELLGEIGRLRARSAEAREACARICDERARDAHNPLADLECDADVLHEVRRSMARRREAESCAAAIRAGGEP